MIELATRAKRFPPPPWVLWESLTEPHRPRGRPWLELREGEVEPRVLQADPPRRLVWSSLWLARPRDEIEVDLTEAGADTILRFTLRTPDEHPGADEARGLRRRLNQLFNAELRLSYDA